MIAIDIRRVTDQPGVKDHATVRLTAFKTTKIKTKGSRVLMQVEAVDDKMFMFDDISNPEALAKAFLTIANYKATPKETK
jgi:hypothetical protein